MKKKLPFLLIIVSWVFMNKTVNADDQYLQLDGTTMVGMAEVDITPPVGYPHYRGISTGKHDPLYTKAIVLGEGKKKTAIVVCDLLWTERSLTTEARLLVTEETGIPFSNIMITGTHTHTSPAYSENILNINPQNRPDNFQIPKIENGEDYNKWLAKQIALAVVKANQNLEPVYIDYGTGLAKGLAHNRRGIMVGGEAKMNPGVGNPETVEAAGPVDEEIGIVFFRRVTDNKPVGSLTNFGLHADTFGGTEFSADYPGVIDKNLKQKFGDGFVSIFGTGPCGDINHINQRKGSTRLTTKEIGDSLTEVVIREIAFLQRLKQKNIDSKSEFVYAPIQKYTNDELEWAYPQRKGKIYSEPDFYAHRRAIKIRSLYEMQQSGEAVAPTVGTEPWTLPMYVQALNVGDEIGIVAIPGELFTELGRKIKEVSPYKLTMVIELNNSYIGYMPTERAFRQGSYETINSRLAPGGGELMAEKGIQLLNDLQRNAMK